MLNNYILATNKRGEYFAISKCFNKRCNSMAKLISTTGFFQLPSLEVVFEFQSKNVLSEELLHGVRLL